MYLCSECKIDYISHRINNTEYDKPITDKEIKGNKYCKLCHISVKDWQRHLNSVIHNLKKHIIEFHKPLLDPNNKGNILCKLCNIKVKDYYKHTFSALHRFNQDLNSIVFFHDVRDFLDHFNHIKNEKDIEDILKPNEDNFFWVTAKQELDEEQYEQLKGEIIGKPRKPKDRTKRRYITLYRITKCR